MESDKRLIIAIAVSVLILIAFSYLNPQREPAPSIDSVSPAGESSATGGSPDEPAEDERSRGREPDDSSGEPTETSIAAESEEQVLIDNGVFEVVLTNRGARVERWTLVDYTTAQGEPLDVFPRFVDEDAPRPLSLDLDDPSLADLLNDALYRVERSDSSTAGERIRFYWSDGRGLSVEKIFEFRSDRYLVDVQVRLTDRGRPLATRLTVGPGFAAQEPSSDHSNYYYQSQALWDVAGNVTRHKRGKLGGDGGLTGDVYWAGLEDQYFTALILPGDPRAVVSWREPALTVIPYTLPGETGETSEPQATPVVAVSVGESGSRMFVGPKRYEMLREIGSDVELQKAVWFSSQNWLRVIVKYIFLGLVWLHDNVANNWGVAIILATLVLRIMLFPVNQYSMVNMKKTQLQMGKLQPKIKAIRNKYRKAKDAQSRQKMNEEMMALYRKEGVNPMGGVSGCLPMLAQFPILIGFYNMLTVAVELRGAPFFGWIHDLSQQDPYRILPILMAVTMFAQQKLAMSRVKDPQQLQQQRIMLFMPIVFGFICLQMPSGLVLYWFVNNLLGMGQQWLVNRHTGRLEAAAQKA